MIWDLTRIRPLLDVIIKEKKPIRSYKDRVMQGM
jgi:hypothetical protein